MESYRRYTRFREYSWIYSFWGGLGGCIFLFSAFVLGFGSSLCWPTLLLPKDAPPADFPFDAAGSPDAIRGATAAVTRMASATCATLTLECPCLAIPECHRCERGAARGNSSLLQSPAAGVDSHAPVDSETQILIHLHPAECGIVSG